MTISKNNIVLLILLLISIISSGCQDKKVEDEQQTYSNSSQNNVKTYIFGVHPLLNSKKLFEVYQPLVDKINDNLIGAKIKLESSINYAAFNKKMMNGHFDFALPNPYQTITSFKYGYRVFGKMGDDFSFRGIILVRKDSGITKETDLIGKTVSYPAPTALAATMMPQYYLQTHGVDINKDIKNKYVGTHASAIMNVYLGNSIASATWPLAWKTYTKTHPKIAQEVEIKWQTDKLINNGLIVKIGTSTNIIKTFEDIVFNLQKSAEGRKILEPMAISKYEPATNKTFNIVTSFLDKFKITVRALDIK